jgi:hypothetical protein
VGVGEDKMILIPAFLDQLVAEPSNAGSGVHNDQIVVFGSDLHTSGIAAIF